MFSDLISTVILFVCGLFGGLFLGLGMGTTGAVLITAMTVFLGYSIHYAIGTSLLVDCIIGGVAGVIYFSQHRTNFRPALLMAGTGAFGSFIGSQFTSRAPAISLLILLSILLIAFGISFVRSGLRRNLEVIGDTIRVHRFKKHVTLVLGGTGLFAGIASGFTGVGVGGVVVTTLILILEYDLTTAIGTALLCLVFISGFGALGHAFHNEIIYPVVLIACSGAAIGAITGSLIATKINEERLGQIIGVILIIMGILLTLRIFQ